MKLGFWSHAVNSIYSYAKTIKRRCKIQESPNANLRLSSCSRICSIYRSCLAWPPLTPPQQHGRHARVVAVDRSANRGKVRDDS
jgi:hypothetical protein